MARQLGACAEDLARRRRDQPGAISSGSMEVKFVVAAFECPGRMSAAAVSQASAKRRSTATYPLCSSSIQILNDRLAQSRLRTRRFCQDGGGRTCPIADCQSPIEHHRCPRQVGCLVLAEAQRPEGLPFQCLNPQQLSPYAFRLTRSERNYRNGRALPVAFSPDTSHKPSSVMYTRP